MKTVSALAAACSLALLWPATSTFAQDNPPGGPRPDGGRDGRRFNPDDYRKMIADRMKAAMKVSDEEWTVLQPLIEKVSEKGREVMAGRFGGGFGRGPGGPGGPGGGDRPPGSPGSPGSPGGGDRGGDRGRGPSPSPESQALRESLEKDGVSNDEIQAKLTAVRGQRKKAQAELEAAREELKKVVTVRQEAVLVAMGVLE